MLALSLMLLWLQLSAAADTVVNIMLMPTIPDSEKERNDTQSFLDQNFTPASGIKVNVQMSSTLVTTDYSSMVKLYLTTQDPSIDIFMIDVVWPGDLQQYLVDMTPFITPDVSAQHIPQVWNNDIVANRHVALPFYADYGVMYYRKDLLAKYGFTSPPTTWDSLEQMAATVMKGEGADMAGYIGEFDAYEGLTCSVVEWLASAEGGSIVDLDGTVTFNNPNASSILQRVRGWFSDITPKYALSYQETPALTKWLSGKAVFMRTWPYAAGVTNSANVSWTFGITGLPGVTSDLKFASALGGWHIAANRATKNLNATAQTMLFLTSAAFQRHRAISVNVLPTITSLYSDPVVCAKIDCNLFGSLRVVTRPAAQTAPNYLAVSANIYTAVNQYLAQQVDIDTMLQTATVRIEQTMGTYSDIVASQASVIKSGSVLGLIFIGVSIVGLFLCILCAILTIINMGKSNIKASSPIFLLVILFGVALGFGTIFVYVGTPTKMLCVLQPWLLVMSFAITFSALIAKTWRIYRIFGNRKLGGAALDTGSLFKFMVVIIVLDAAILGCWTVLFPPVPTAIFTTSESAFVGCVSEKSNVFNSILIVFNGILLVCGSWLAYKTRLVDEKFRESFWIAMLMYNTIVWAVIALSLVFVTNLGLMLQFSIRSASIVLSCVGVLALLFFPKFRDIYGPAAQEVQTLHINDSSTRKRGLSSTATIGATGGISSDEAFERGEAYGHGLTIYYRFGKNPLFLGSWCSSRMYILRESSFRALVLAPDAQDKASAKLGGTCINLQGQCEVSRTERDLEQSVFLIAARLPDGIHYEFMAETADALDFVEKVLRGGGKS